MAKNNLFDGPLPPIGMLLMRATEERNGLSYAVGYHGNKVPLPTKDGRTLVCLAQRGECRYNRRHYCNGLGSEESWSLPQIIPSCDRRCPDRHEATTKDDPKGHHRYREHDPYGFGYYKRASDACRHHDIENHDTTCPECTAPQPEPAEEWQDPCAPQRGDFDCYPRCK